MAAKAKKEDFMQRQRALNQELKEGRFHTVYLVCGDQAYLRIQNRDKLRAALLGGGDEMNVSAYTGNDVTAREVMDQAQTLPFFADRRVVILENTVFFSKSASAESDALAAFLPKIPETASLVFVEEAPDRRKKLYKAIQKQGFVLDCQDVSPQMLGQWAAGLLHKGGLRIDRRTMDLFLETVGDDMMKIVSETDKLIGYCMGREAVTAADIAAVCSPRVQDRIFEMISAISHGQGERGLAIYMDLLSLRTPPQVILTLLQREYARLLQVKELQQQGRQEAEIARAVGLSPWIVRKNYLPVTRNMGAGRIAAALQACLQADQDYKSGKADARLSTEMAIMGLLA